MTGARTVIALGAFLLGCRNEDSSLGARSEASGRTITVTDTCTSPWVDSEREGQLRCYGQMDLRSKASNEGCHLIGNGSPSCDCEKKYKSDDSVAVRCKCSDRQECEFPK